jgi:hypothetical protein
MRTRRSKQKRNIRRNNMSNSNIGILAIVCIVLCSVMLVGSVMNDHKTRKDIPQGWIPTDEDIAYQDSMWNIINQTQMEVDTIKESIDHIINRLDEIE